MPCISSKVFSNYRFWVIIVCFLHCSFRGILFIHTWCYICYIWTFEKPLNSHFDRPTPLFLFELYLILTLNFFHQIFNNFHSFGSDLGKADAAFLTLLALVERLEKLKVLGEAAGDDSANRFSSASLIFFFLCVALTSLFYLIRTNCLRDK